MYIYRTLELFARVARAGWAATIRLTLILIAVAAAASALNAAGLQMFM